MFLVSFSSFKRIGKEHAMHCEIVSFDFSPLQFMLNYFVALALCLLPMICVMVGFFYSFLYSFFLFIFLFECAA